MLYNRPMTNSPGLARLALALCAATSAGSAGCRCGANAGDAGPESGLMLASTNTIVSVASDVAGIEQLHLEMVLADVQLMEGECDYVGNMYDGFVPAISAGEIDLSCPTGLNCPTFHLNWAGAETSSSLGGMRFSGIGDINCQVNIMIEALGAGGAVVATGYTEDAFAFYGVNSGPRSLTMLAP